MSVTVNCTVKVHIGSRNEAEHRLDIDDLYRVSHSDRLLSYKG